MLYWIFVIAALALTVWIIVITGRPPEI